MDGCLWGFPRGEQVNQPARLLLLMFTNPTGMFN